MRRKYAKESEKKMCKNETKKRKRRMRVSRKKNPDKTNERTDNKPCTIEKRRTGKTMTGRRGARGPSGGPNAGPEPVNTPPPPGCPPARGTARWQRGRAQLTPAGTAALMRASYRSARDSGGAVLGWRCSRLHSRSRAPWLPRCRARPRSLALPPSAHHESSDGGELWYMR